MSFTQKEINDFYDLLHLNQDENPFHFYKQTKSKVRKYPKGIFITHTSHNLKEFIPKKNNAKLESDIS